MVALSTEALPRTQSRVPWMPLLVFASLSLAVFPALHSLYRYWIEIRDYNYGFLIAAISLYWLGRIAIDGRFDRSQSSTVMLAPLFVSLAAWYVLWHGNNLLGAQLLVPIVFAFAFASLIGLRPSIRLLEPLGYFYFAIPVWDYLVPYLQKSTVFGAELSMRLAGVSYTTTGTRVAIPEGVFEVLPTCAGLRYLVVSVAVMTLYGVIERVTRLRMAMLIFTAAVLAILANWLRVFIVMYAGHVTKMAHYFVSNSHEGIGHVVFAGLIVVLFVIARSLRREPQAEQSHAHSAGAIAVPRWNVVVPIVVMGLLVAALSWRADRLATNLQPPQLKPLPVAQGKWLGPMPIGQSEWSPKFDGALASMRAAYLPVSSTHIESSAADRIEVYANVYGVQAQGKELVFYLNSVTAPGVWQHRASRDSMGGGAVPVLHVEEFSPENELPGEAWLIGRTYVVGGRSSSTGLAAEVLYGLSTLTTPAPGGVMAVAVRCGTSCRNAEVLLSGFWNEMGAKLTSSIPREMTSE